MIGIGVTPRAVAPVCTWDRGLDPTGGLEGEGGVLLDPVPSEDDLICKPDTMMFLFRLLSEGTGTVVFHHDVLRSTCAT